MKTSRYDFLVAVLPAFPNLLKDAGQARCLNRRQSAVKTTPEETRGSEGILDNRILNADLTKVRIISGTFNFKKKSF